MTARRTLLSILVLPQMLIPASVQARVARPPELVGAPFVDLRSECHLRIETPGGTRLGAQVPIPALRLGASVRRGSLSFTTGGSGTGNATEALRRRRAGLQSEPRTFDVAATAQPEVYAEPASQAATRLPYQRLPLKTISTAYDPSVLVFAQATSATSGRVVSVEITMRRPPVAKPSLRILGDAQFNRTRCSPAQGLAVYAPAMTVGHIRRLFAPSGCNWYNLTNCKRADRPHGTVLFVRAQGSGHVHRWIDYDALGRIGNAN